MTLFIKKYKSKGILMCLLISACLAGKESKCQQLGAYPPFTKWYQDPLGLKPLQLSTAFGIVWSSAAVATSLIFTTKDTTLQKRISTYNETGLSIGYKWPYTSSFQNDAGFMVDVRKWMSIGVGWNTIHFKDKMNNTWCFGIRPFARWNALKTKKLSTYFEYGAGICYSLNQFPLSGIEQEADTGRIGTHFNLNSKYGIGAIFKCNTNVSVQLSIRHYHLSNGNIKGIKRNPSYDSNGFFLGVFYKFNNNNKPKQT